MKTNLINEYQVDSEDKEFISKLDFENKNSNVYSLDNSETERDEICMIIENEENQPKKTPLNLENLVQHLENKLNPCNLQNIYK